MNLDDSLRDRATANGSFEDMAQLSQALKFALRRGRNWEALPMEGKEALEQIATHIARILSGDSTDPAHWNEIAAAARIRGKTLDVSLESGMKTIVSRLRSVALPDEPA
jgi:hypothetical protein